MLVADRLDAGAAQRAPEKEALAKASEAAKLDVRSAKTYARLYRFLKSEYASLLSSPNLKMGSAAGLQLARLHECAPVEAHKLAPKVFSGEISPRDLKRRRETLLSHAKGNVEPPARVSIMRKSVLFERHAAHLICADPGILGLGKGVAVSAPAGRKTMSPDLVASVGKRRIAVEIKAAGPASTTHIAAHLARLAQLEQVYDGAILVLPAQCADLAEKAIAQQEAWNGARPHIVMVEPP